MHLENGLQNGESNRKWLARKQWIFEAFVDQIVGDLLVGPTDAGKVGTAYDLTFVEANAQVENDVVVNGGRCGVLVGKVDGQSN